MSSVIQHGTLEVDNITASLVLLDKIFTYLPNDNIDTITEVYSNGISKIKTFSWDINGNVTNIDEEYI